MRCFAAILIWLSGAGHLPAQTQTHEPLNEVQIEQIREAGNRPVDRVNLYAKFLGEHAETIKGLTNRARSDARARRLDDELQQLTALMDELGSNLDQYADRHADIRKALKPLTDTSQHWVTILHALPGEPAFDLSRKEAIESCEELADQIKRLEVEQTEYFKVHKDEAGQDRGTALSRSDVGQRAPVICRQWLLTSFPSFSRSTGRCARARRCRPFRSAFAASHR
jgi:hypothetical protein